VIAVTDVYHSAACARIFLQLVTVLILSRWQKQGHCLISWPLTFDVESGVRVTCDVGYLYANFSLPWPLCSRVRSDVRDRQTDRRQTDVRQKHRLMSPPYGGGGGGIITTCALHDSTYAFNQSGDVCEPENISRAALCLDSLLCLPALSVSQESR